MMLIQIFKKTHEEKIQERGNGYVTESHIGHQLSRNIIQIKYIYNIQNTTWHFTH